MRLPAIDTVADRLILGPCPNSPEFVASLRVDHAISGLVSVQTDGDLERLGLSWPLLWRFLVSNSIATRRVPIEDFKDKALRQGLDNAVAAVDELHTEGHTVYLHCTAGVNRSPTVAIGWLVKHGGLSLDDAWRQVTTRRPCDPNRKVLQAWVGG